MSGTVAINGRQEYLQHASDTVSLTRELGITDQELIEIGAGPYSGRVLISWSAMEKYRKQLLAMGFVDVSVSRKVRLRKDDMTVTAQMRA